MIPNQGIEVFRDIDPDAPLIVGKAVWQYPTILPDDTHRGALSVPMERHLPGWSVFSISNASSQRLAPLQHSVMWILRDFSLRVSGWLTTGQINMINPTSAAWLI